MKYPKTKIYENEGINYIANVVNNMCCIWREIAKDDIGIDGYIELIENEKSTGLIIAVQSKSGKSFFQNESKDHFIYYPKKDHIYYWDSLNLPTILIIYSPQKKIGYWLDIKQYILKNPIPEDRGYNIFFKKKIFNERSKKQLFSLAKNYMKDNKNHIIDTVEIDEDLKITFFKGLEARDDKNYDEALKILFPLYKKYPNHYYILRNICHSLCKLQRYEEAYDIYLEAIERNFNVIRAPNIKDSFKDLWYCAGLFVVFWEESLGSIDLLKKYVDKDPNNTIFLANLACGLRKAGKMNEAIEPFNKITELSPLDEEMWYIKGMFFRENQQYDDALSCLNKVLEIEPDHTWAKTMIEDIKKYEILK